MKTVSATTLSSVRPGRAAQAARVGLVADLTELIKARLTGLVLFTTAAGYYLGAKEPISWWPLLHTIIGTGLAAAGAAALNQRWEYRLDALMQRTQLRPVPSGRMQPREALLVGLILSGAGVLYLILLVNWLAASLAGITILIYILAYTPLKLLTTANTLVGAIPGAIPPLIGWAAAQGRLTWSAWTLFAILFCWQMPHFFAIAWMYREDYARAGFRMLSTRDLDGGKSGAQSVLFATLLAGASLMPPILGLTSLDSIVFVVFLGLAFLILAIRFWRRRRLTEARVLFIGSIVYLPLLLGVLLWTKK